MALAVGLPLANGATGIERTKAGSSCFGALGDEEEVNVSHGRRARRLTVAAAGEGGGGDADRGPVDDRGPLGGQVGEGKKTSRKPQKVGMARVLPMP